MYIHHRICFQSKTNTLFKKGDEKLWVSFKIHLQNEHVRLLTQYLGWRDEIERYLFHVGTFSYILYNIT